MLLKKYLFSVLFLLLVLSCANPTPEVSFYIWKSNPNLTQNEVEFFEKTKAKNLYLRVFDVDLVNGRREPKAILQNFDSRLISTAYTPVVFITNESFRNISKGENKALAQNVFQLIEEIAQKFEFDYQEIQIDADWTATTREAFFLFLENLQELSAKKISSTLRLHQVKYRAETGIPPVDKVYLMAYATSSPVENQEINSILDLDLLKDYLQEINDYPLSFDVALPLYSWAIVTNHLGRKKIVNAVRETDLTHPEFKFENGYYIAQKEVFLKGFLVNEGFKIKLESISPELLQETKTYLRKHIKKPYHLVYYHLDEQFTQQFNPEDL